MTTYLVAIQTADPDDDGIVGSWLIDKSAEEIAAFLGLELTLTTPEEPDAAPKDGA